MKKATFCNFFQTRFNPLPTCNVTLAIRTKLRQDFKLSVLKLIQRYPQFLMEYFEQKRGIVFQKFARVFFNKTYVHANDPYHIVRIYHLLLGWKMHLGSSVNRLSAIMFEEKLSDYDDACDRLLGFNHKQSKLCKKYYVKGILKKEFDTVLSAFSRVLDNFGTLLAFLVKNWRTKRFNADGIKLDIIDGQIFELSSNFFLIRPRSFLNLNEEIIKLFVGMNDRIIKMFYSQKSNKGAPLIL